MTTIQSFTFNPFQENTYIISNDSKECIIIDPGCSNSMENEIVEKYISQHALKPIRLLNTHCHIDHILGNSFISKKYNLKLSAHKLEEQVLAGGENVSRLYGVPYVSSPLIENFLDENLEIQLGNVRFQIIHAPGHSPGSICFHNKEEGYLIGGDVLFYGSIGRTDLPGGNHSQLLESIKEKLFLLPENTTVYSGHGNKTSIGYEKKTNPFCKL